MTMPRLDSCPQIWPKWEKMDSDRGCGFLSHCPPSLINLSCGNVSNNGIMDMLQFISLQSFSLNGQRANVNAEQALPIDPRVNNENEQMEEEEEEGTAKSFITHITHREGANCGNFFFYFSCSILAKFSKKRKKIEN